MRIEDLLDELAVECNIDEYRDMFMYNGGSSDSPLKSNINCLNKVVKNKIDKSKSDEEKRILESAQHYFNAFQDIITTVKNRKNNNYLKLFI